MKRKVVKHGPATSIISLPSKWAKRYGIKRGDELEVQDKGNYLLISTENQQQSGKVSADITGLDRTSILFLIRSLYKTGYEEIKLTFRNQSTQHKRLGKERTVISVIHEEVNRLTGLEVVQQREDLCVIKALSVMSYEEYDSTLRRVFLMLLDATSDLIKGAENNDNLALKTIQEKHDTITKFLAFCVRVLNTKGHEDRMKNIFANQILADIDKVLDVLKNVSRTMIELKPKVSRGSADIMRDIENIIKEFHEFFYRYDNEKITRIFDLRDDIPKRLKSEAKNMKKEELMVMSQMTGIIDLVVDMVEARMAMGH
ncbi:MAG: AbrB/MazE/SpoVT family DNA-binding domain-containing protein [Candidatus Woesearchaeota archaeon]